MKSIYYFLRLVTTNVFLQLLKQLTLPFLKLLFTTQIIESCLSLLRNLLLASTSQVEVRRDPIFQQFKTHQKLISYVLILVAFFPIFTAVSYYPLSVRYFCHYGYDRMDWRIHRGVYNLNDWTLIYSNQISRDCSNSISFVLNLQSFL